VVIKKSFRCSTPPYLFFSVYLPTHLGCTEAFKESLDYFDSLIGLFGYENDVVILGDINADHGPAGRPMGHGYYPRQQARQNPAPIPK